MKRTNLVILAALACASAPVANGQTPTQPAVDPSPSSRIATFIGDATCAGTPMAMGKNSGPADTGRYHAEKALDGNWVVVRYRQDQSAANPHPFEVVQYFGYDPANKHYLTVMVGNGAGVHSTGSSDGWRGNSITFDEVEWARGKSHSSRETFTTRDSGLSGYTAWSRDKQGKWIKMYEETCHKA